MEPGFWAQEIAAGKELKVKIPEGLALKISNVALAVDGKPLGTRTGSLIVKHKGKDVAAANLSANAASAPVDIVFHAGDAPPLKAVGSTLHLIGTVASSVAHATNGVSKVPASPKVAPQANKTVGAASPKLEAKTAASPKLEAKKPEQKKAEAKKPEQKKADAKKPEDKKIVLASKPVFASAEEMDEIDFDDLEGDEMDEGDEGDEGDDFPFGTGPFAGFDDESEEEPAVKGGKRKEPAPAQGAKKQKGAAGKPVAQAPQPQKGKPGATPAKSAPQQAKVTPQQPAKGTPGKASPGGAQGKKPNNTPNKPNAQKQGQSPAQKQGQSPAQKQGQSPVKNNKQQQKPATPGNKKQK